MFLVGLSSHTFFLEKPQRIVELAQASGVQGLEWQAESHCQVGDLKQAHELRTLTEQAGLVCLSYAVDACGDEPERERAAVHTAFELGASMLRVIPETRVEQSLGSLSRCYHSAAELGLMISVGLSGESSAGSGVEAQALIDQAGGEHADILWSRDPFPSDQHALHDLSAVAEHVVGLYCSGLHPDGNTQALGERTDEWARYLSVLSQVDDDHWIVVRGVENADPAALFRDMQTLRRLVEKYGT